MFYSTDFICIHIIFTYFSFFQFCLSTRKFDEVRLKELKNFVRRNQPVIFNFIKELLVFLKQPFVEIRIAVLLICDEFFQRSHVFRLELSNRLHVCFSFFKQFLIYHILKRFRFIKSKFFQFSTYGAYTVE